MYLPTSTTESCDEDDEVSVGVVEELVDKPGTSAYICVVLTYNDSSIFLRKTCQIPRNCKPFGKVQNATGVSVQLRRHHFYFCFRFLRVHATSFLVLHHSYSNFFSMRDAVQELRFPAMKKRMKNLSIDQGQRRVRIFLPFLMRCGF